MTLRRRRERFAEEVADLVEAGGLGGVPVDRHAAGIVRLVLLDAARLPVLPEGFRIALDGPEFPAWHMVADRSRGLWAVAVEYGGPSQVGRALAEAATAAVGELAERHRVAGPSALEPC